MDDPSVKPLVWVASSKKDHVVLHAFQKKSKKGIGTPQHEVDLVAHRYDQARQIHEREFGSKKGRKK